MFLFFNVVPCSEETPFNKFYVQSNGDVLSIFNLDYGSVQGSVLGPVLFCIFTRPFYSKMQGNVPKSLYKGTPHPSPETSKIQGLVNI